MVKLNEMEKKQAVIEKHENDEPEEKTKTSAKTEKGKTETKAQSAKPAEKTLKSSATLHDLEVVLYPLVTEKAVNMIEAENKITFVVNDNASKPEVKKVLEEAYGVKVSKVNIIRDMKGRKKAIVQLDKKFKASELATKLGVL